MLFASVLSCHFPYPRPTPFLSKHVLLSVVPDAQVDLFDPLFAHIFSYVFRCHGSFGIDAVKVYVYTSLSFFAIFTKGGGGQFS